MSNYTKTTNFAAKDSLPSGNANKIVKGSEIDAEFNNIATASATKADSNNGTLTGTTVFETLSDGTTSITGWIDEDNMASDSAALVPTQQSVKAYVDSQVTAQDLDVTDGSASIDIDLDSESLGILGGTGIDSTASGTAVTLAIDSTVATLTGSQTLTNKTLTAPAISGNLTTNGLLDGRDVATDGSKLDTIEAGATADQTAAEIKTAYESNADTNAFTDADHSKLDGIEAGADITDTANVTSAGALMDSELTSESAVKALNQGVATTDSPTFAGITTSGTTNTANLTIAGGQGLDGQVLTSTGSGVQWEYSSSGGSGGGNFSTFSVDKMTGDGSTTALTLGANPLAENNTQVYIDGVYQPKSTYSLSGLVLTFSTAPPSGSAVEVTSSPNVIFSSDTMTGDGSDTTLSLSVNPGTENNTVVYIDGVYQPKSTYSVSGTTLTFSTAPPSGSSVEVMLTSTADAFNVASMTGDGSDTTLTLPSSPGTANNTLVFIDGVYQPKSSYGINGTTLTFFTAPPNNTSVEAVVGDDTNVNVPSDGSVSTNTLASSSVTSEKLADSSVTSEKLANSSVTSAKLSGDLTTPSNLTVTGTTDTTNFKVGGAQGTDGQVLTSTGSGVAWENAGGGRWTQIATSTIGSSEVFSVEFTNISGYQEYELRWVGLTGSSSLENFAAMFDYGSGFVNSDYAIKSYQIREITTTAYQSFFEFKSDTTRKSIILSTFDPNRGTSYGYMYGTLNWTTYGSIINGRNFSHGSNADDRQSDIIILATNNSNRASTITGVKIFASGGGAEDDEPVTSANDGFATGTFTLYGLKVT